MDQVVHDARRVYSWLSPGNASEYNRMRAAQRLQRLFTTLRGLEDFPNVVSSQDSNVAHANMGLIVTLLRQPPWTEPLLRLLLFTVIACIEARLNNGSRSEKRASDTGENSIVAVANVLDTYFQQPYWTLKLGTASGGAISMHSVVEDDVVRSKALIATYQLLNLPNITSADMRMNMGRLCTAYTCALRTLILKQGLASISTIAKDVSPSSDVMLSERLEAIANAAEGDMGRMAFKDLVLSFRLPRSIVGVRKSLLLHKDVHTAARKSHASLVHSVHSLAMLGALAAWKGTQNLSKKDDDDEAASTALFVAVPFTPEEQEIHRSCALLSGLAMLLSTGNQEDIINGIAFEGRVFLPFLFDMSSVEATTPVAGANEAEEQQSNSAPTRRLFFEAGRWVLCRLADGKLLEVLVSGEGLEGLSRCVVSLLDAEQPNTW